MPKLTTDYPETLRFRLGDKAKAILEGRAKARGLTLSEYARKLIVLGLSVDAGTDAAETKRNLSGLGVTPNERQGAKSKGEPVEYKPEDETSRRVRETLESKGLKEAREPKSKGIRFRADGYPK